MNDLQKGSLSQTRRNGDVPPSVCPFFPCNLVFYPSAEPTFCFAIPAPCLSRLSRRRRWPPVSSEEVRKMKKAGSSPLPSSAEPHHLSWKSVQDPYFSPSISKGILPALCVCIQNMQQRPPENPTWHLPLNISRDTLSWGCFPSAFADAPISANLVFIARNKAARRVGKKHDSTPLPPGSKKAKRGCGDGDGGRVQFIC